MIRIFIVEDHGVVRAGLENLLKKNEYITIAAMAKSGADALRILAQGIEADVLLTDLHLGDMTGIELAERIRAQKTEMEAIILTMETDQRFMIDAFRTGVKGYLLKEADADELIHGIRKVYEGRHFICTALTSRVSERLLNERIYAQPVETNVDLSRRETEILHLLSDGFTNLQIADKLFTSRRTVEGHRQALLNKAGVRNTPELIKYAMLHGLINIPAIN